MRSAPRSVPLLLIFAFALTTAAIAAPVPHMAGVAGRVTGDANPLAAAKVYAYELADLTLRKAVTDEDGRFQFANLPAGLYKIIAVKGGFSPAIVLLTRAAAEASQFVEVELTDARSPNETAADSFWKLRSEIPPDVLRDLRSSSGIDGGQAGAGSGSATLASLAGHVQVINGSDQGLEFGNAMLQGGKVGVQGRLHDLKVGVQGHFLRLASSPGTTTAAGAVSSGLMSGAAQALKVQLNNGGGDQINVTGLNDRLGPATDSSAVGFEHYGVDWSRAFGGGAQSNLSAQYTSEQNFYRQGGWGPMGIPDSSRSWRIAGSYTNSLSDISTLQAGFRFRSRQGDGLTPAANGLVATGQRLDLFGRGGYRVQPAMLVEYGLFSTLADGSVSLTPRGGVVLQLGKHWKAATSASMRVSESGSLNRGDFFTAFYDQLNNCGEAETYCYKVMLSRDWGHGEQLSLAALDRKFADTLQLYFSQNFFDHLESLYVVRGDNLPELRFSFTSRLSPTVLAKFESNVAAGGGGVFYSGDQQPYQNQVRYLVTSIDTHFEKTSTGVFIAFHRLEQGLSPAGSNAAPGTEQTDLERVQVVLTQGLDALLDVASRWAVQFNLELSRGTIPGLANTTLAARNDVRKRLTGGLTVSF